jgi:hypothetical protein
MTVLYSYEEFLSHVSHEHKHALVDKPDTRFGQTFFNCLWEFRPAIANRIRATEIDPFHREEVYPETHVVVEEMWNKMNQEDIEKGIGE